MATWNSTINGTTTQMSDLTWLQHLCNAVNQRLSLTTGSSFSVASGDDVQTHSFWSPLQENVSDSLAVIGGGFQPMTPPSPASSWLNIAAPLDPTNGFNGWTEATLRTSLGLTNGVNRDGSTPTYYWRRQRPRTITTPTDTTDTDGNTIVNGQIAWITNPPLGAALLAKKVNPITDPTSPPGLTPNYAPSGPTLGPGTYYVQFTFYNGVGETLPSPEANVTLTAPGTIIVTVPSLPSTAKVACVYVSTTSGLEQLNDTTPTTTVEINSLARSLQALPTTNYTQWIPAGPTDVPDRNDSNNALSTNAHVDPGLMLGGDYIASEILTELRSMLNAMVWFADTNPSVNDFAGDVESGLGATPAAATAAYPTFESNDTDKRLGSATAADNGFGPLGTEFFVRTTSTTLTTSSLNAAFSITEDFYVYLTAAADGGPGFAPLPANITFNAQGSGFPNSQWSLWTSVNSTTGGAVNTPTWPVSNPPNFPTHVIGTATGTGYAIIQDNGGGTFVQAVGVQKYDVAGGFAETASSP